MHRRTLRDQQWMRPLHPPIQRIANADGDVFERRGRLPLEAVDPADRPLVLTAPDGLVEPPGPPAPPRDPGPKITALAYTVLTLVLVAIGILAILALKKMLS